MRRYVAEVSKIVQQLDIESVGASRTRPDEWSWLAEPEQPRRRYNSSLSSPGRLCGICRGFVAGRGTEICGHCGAGR
ncbi:MAG: hypothetical protein M3Z54_05765 [Gemmatimonadota bacterium]|nr:hypothetical protein [Gemmatimonadota bacterium]